MQNDVIGRSYPQGCAERVTRLFDDTLDTGATPRLDRYRMSYRVEIDGHPIVMDSPREVFQLLQEAKKLRIPRLSLEATEVANGEAREWSAETCEAFREMIRQHVQQTTLIGALLAAESEWLTKSQLMHSLKITDGQQLGGSLSGITKNAQRLGLPSPIECERLQVDGKRTSRYRLAKPFSLALLAMFEKRRREKEEAKNSMAPPPMDDDDDIP